MNSNALIIQDLIDILHISDERINDFNKTANNFDNLQINMLLRKEIDQTQNSILAIKRLVLERFDFSIGYETKGPLFSMWNEFKPTLDATDESTQLLDFEMADLLTLQCYCLVITRPYIDDITKSLLEYHYQNHLVCYYNIKAFRKSYQKSSSDILYPSRKSA